ncbi:proteinase inhibitor I4 serpin-like protein, partial [Leptotrombidium deliense]
MSDTFIIKSNPKRIAQNHNLKMSRSTIEFGLVSLNSMIQANFSNPLIPSFIGLSGQLALISKINRTTRMEMLEQCGINPSLVNIPDVVKRINLTDINSCYNAVNLVVVANNFNVKDEFWMYSQTYKYINITKGNFGSTKDQERIRGLLKKGTNSEIDDEIDSFVKLNKRQQVVLISASSFNEKFAVQFDVNKTKNGTFYNDGHNATFVPMMRQKGEYKHYSDDKVSALDIPLETGNHVLFMLPHQNVTIRNLIANATSAYIENVLKNLQAKNISIKLPRFKSSIQKQFKDFNYSPKLDKDFIRLSNVTTGGPVVWSDMYMLSSIEVNEHGAKQHELNVSALELPHFYIHRPTLNQTLLCNLPYCIKIARHVVITEADVFLKIGWE